MSSRMGEKASLKVLVAGGGIAGLAAALGLRQQGHEVIVFERTELAKEFGAAIHVGPNCHSLLKKLGIFPEALGANRMEAIIQHDENGNVLREMDLRNSMDIWEDPWVLCHRVSIHEKLKEKATETIGPSLPVTLRVASPVVNVDPSTATIFLADGSKHTGDLIIGADGVSSITRKFVVGPDIKPFPYGKNMFRFMIPREQIRQSAEIAHFVEKDGCMRSWRNDGCTLIMYPCQNNMIMNFAGIHPRDMSPAKGEGWDQEATKEKLLEIFGTFGPKIKELLNLADNTTLRVWSILDMERIPRWYNERLVLMGDAAHPFQPSCIAVEDAISLVCLLPRGTLPDELADRLALYQKIRDERAHKVQQATRMSGRDLSEEARKAYDWTKSIAYNFGHNEWHNSTRLLKEHLWKQS
ncbi:unnamed protein product [Clonostachys rosea]|uniref:FAD-binding domain-containing protein n=1 Tax=Bionectria ochroleuca TaxID=29856 RepID=A0ABY6U2M3_BIOOC|nr:unnamed protein product [Clonostachys rosea]